MLTAIEKIEAIIEWSLSNTWFDTAFLDDIVETAMSGTLTPAQERAVNNIYVKFVNKDYYQDEDAHAAKR